MKWKVKETKVDYFYMKLEGDNVFAYQNYFCIKYKHIKNHKFTGFLHTPKLTGYEEPPFNGGVTTAGLQIGE